MVRWFRNSTLIILRAFVCNVYFLIIYLANELQDLTNDYAVDILDDVRNKILY